MSQNEVNVTSHTRLLTTKKVDPILTIGAAIGVGAGGCFVYKAITTAPPTSVIAFLVIGIVLLGIGIASFASGGWRPLFL